jgi:hypothetical protein
MKFRKGKPRPTGVSTPILGVQWEYRTGERQALEQLVAFLSARRALSASYEWEDEDHLNQSVIEIRGVLNSTLAASAHGSETYRLVEGLQDLCNEFLNAVGRPRTGKTGLRQHTQQALQKLRESFRVKLAYIGKEGGIAAALELAAKIPTAMSPDGPLGKMQRVIYVDPPDWPPSWMLPDDSESGTG